jgi:hypothetical protein
MPRLRRRSGWPMPDNSSNCGELNAPTFLWPGAGLP